ncbi:MAG: sigma-70 family RNA polymerase sigma factor [Planctomycetota bacterium]|nr:sigma-70 family RNA polymerase sigma factor [Planctomycetota bacterium]
MVVLPLREDELVVNQNCQTQQIELMVKPTLRVNQSAAQGVSKITLRTLFDSEETPLLRYAFSLTGRRAVAEEIVQEVFLQLHTHWDNVDSPRAWLFRSVRNRAYNHIRDNRREILHSDDHNVQSPTDEDETPEAGLLRMEAIGTLRQMVEGLGETDRQLVKLKYFEDLKYRDISAQTGLSISNVGYRLHHILKELADKLRPLGIDGMS